MSTHTHEVAKEDDGTLRCITCGDTMPDVAGHVRVLHKPDADTDVPTPDPNPIFTSMVQVSAHLGTLGADAFMADDRSTFDQVSAASSAFGRLVEVAWGEDTLAEVRQVARGMVRRGRG